jgi:hypothetical protein
MKCNFIFKERGIQINMRQGHDLDVLPRVGEMVYFSDGGEVFEVEKIMWNIPDKYADVFVK